MSAIRPMLAADKPQVMTLLRQTPCTEEEIAVAEEQMDIYLNDDRRTDYRLIVIDHEQTVAGYLCYGPTPLTRGTYDLYGIAVSPDFQGHGLGKRLLGWLENKVQEEHGRLVRIETSSQEKYKAIRAFYLKARYQECARLVDFYQPGDDRIFYVKYLEQNGSMKPNG
ncbi:GNAT family N-acetyltransferase [bacterium]|nr:GNAT family N-acetyltransferase [bacterium]